MGPFSSNSFFVKTIAFNRSRPTTSTSIQIPFNLLSQSIQAMRKAGITVTAVTSVSTGEESNKADKKAAAPSESRQSKRELEKVSTKKDIKTTTRRTRKKS
jgi:hypothetical protein